jgi:hypothetical protein
MNDLTFSVVAIPNSALQSTIEDFIGQIALICTYFAAGMLLYINTRGGWPVFTKGMLSLKNLFVHWEGRSSGSRGLMSIVAPSGIL